MSLALFNSIHTGAIETLFDGENKPWFKRADLGRYLGIAKVKNSMHIPSHFMCKRQDIIGAQVPGALGKRKNSHDVFVNLDGVIKIVTTSRKPKTLELAEALGIDTHKQKFLSKEQETISIIMQVFKGIKMIDQYTVDNYRIDLYFPEHKLVVKCDEFDHADRDIEYEVKRQNHIEVKLGCTFICCNPDAKKFDLFEVINRIIRAIYLKKMC